MKEQMAGRWLIRGKDWVLHAVVTMSFCLTLSTEDTCTTIRACYIHVHTCACTLLTLHVSHNFKIRITAPMLAKVHIKINHYKLFFEELFQK